MRNASNDQLAALRAEQTQFRLRVEIEDSAGNMIDWTNILGDGRSDMVVSAEWGDDLDEHFQTADLEVRYRLWESNASPYAAAVRWEGYLAVGREVVIYLAALPGGLPLVPGNVAAYEEEVFRGTISELDLTDNQYATVSARDALGATLADRWIEEDTTYGTTGGRDIEDVIDDILGDWITAPDVPPTVVVPSTPSWALTEYNQEVTDCLDATSKLVDQIGWDWRVRWNDAAGAWRWTLSEPDRSAGPGDELWTFRPQDITAISRAGVSLESIRNVVDVWYDGGDTSSDGAAIPSKVRRSDASSIAAYGRRWMQVTEGSSSNIDSQAQAERMADAILGDLKDPGIDAEVELDGLWWFVEINDFYEFEADGIRFGANQYMAVTGYRHSASGGSFTTSLTLSGAPRSGRIKWQDVLAHPAKAPTRNTSLPPQPSASVVVGGLSLDVLAALPQSLQWDWLEFHRGTVSGFTPGPSSLRAISRSNRFSDMTVERGTEYHYRVIARTADRNEGEASDEISGTALGVDRDQMAGGLVSGVCVERVTSNITGLADGDVLEFNSVRLGSSGALSSGVVTIVRSVYTITARLLLDAFDNCSDWSVSIMRGDPLGSPTALWTSETRLVDADPATLDLTYTADLRTGDTRLWLRINLTDDGGTASAKLLIGSYLDVVPSTFDPSFA